MAFLLWNANLRYAFAYWSHGVGRGYRSSGCGDSPVVL